MSAVVIGLNDDAQTAQLCACVDVDADGEVTVHELSQFCGSASLWERLAAFVDVKHETGSTDAPLPSLPKELLAPLGEQEQNILNDPKQEDEQNFLPSKGSEPVKEPLKEQEAVSKPEVKYVALPAATDAEVEEEALPPRPLSFPLLLWLDTNGADAFDREYAVRDAAKAAKADVRMFDTLAAFQEFVKANVKDLFFARPSDVRIITNNAQRHEQATDLNGGEHVLRWLRGRRLRMPVLVYCNYTLPSAKEAAKAFQDAFASNEPEVAASFAGFKVANA
jgi:hypothetical protein